MKHVKQPNRKSKKSGTPPVVWIMVAIGAVAVLAGLVYFAYRTLNESPENQQPLPEAADLSAMPRPQLPEGEALPRRSDEQMQLPEGSPLPEGEGGEAPDMPQGPPLPEREDAQQPEPQPQEQSPSGEVLWGASVHPFKSNIPMVQPPAGYMFVTALYRVVNRSTVTVHVDHHATSLTYGGRTYHPYVWASGMDAMQQRRFLSPVDLMPGSATEGYVAFQLPQGARDVVPHLSLQGLPPTIEVRRVSMDQLPPVRGPQPTVPAQ